VPFGRNKDLIVHPAPKRYHYRNRVQLHYDANKKVLGYHSRDKKTIIDAPGCLLPHPEIKKAIAQLYQNHRWPQNTNIKKRPIGHVEFYLKDDQVHENWNQGYAHQGFSQVNPDMNEQLIQLVKEMTLQMTPPPQKALDLFGGQGNLSAGLPLQKATVIDSEKPQAPLGKAHQHFVPINLYQKKSLKRLADLASHDNYELLIVDPPRSGWKELKEACELFCPDSIFYVSCNPSTLFRDLKPLANSYQLIECHLFDFFPSTYHWETCVKLHKIR
jgi:23S rRNA (uracil1939-C5)-methyltransferase